jgi:hypothetical protein
MKLKELRDVLQTARSEANQGFVDALGKTKDAIGEWHDWETLISIARDVLEHGAGCKLLQRMKTISQEKYDSALTAANALRRQYAKATTREESQPRAGRGDASRSVLRTITAMAS